MAFPLKRHRRSSSDRNGIETYDETHSTGEERFLILGLSRQVRVLVVSCAYREEEATIRIISARKATRKEQAYYQGDVE